jgi:hypothetical protein
LDISVDSVVVPLVAKKPSRACCDNGDNHCRRAAVSLSERRRKPTGKNHVAGYRFGSRMLVPLRRQRRPRNANFVENAYKKFPLEREINLH